MLRRLVKHEKEGLINSATCPTVSDTIYFLTKKGAPIVAAKYGMDITDIWVNFNNKTLEHDLIAAGCAKKIFKEAVEKNLFHLAHLIPECGLKTEKLKKGVFYPDVFIGIRGAEKISAFDLEVDCGSISRKDFMGKINYFRDGILVVTKTSERLDLLLWYLRAGKVTKPVHLTTVKNFHSTDFLSCQWHSNISESPITIKIL
jgi:hypothetical protein